MKKMEFQDNTYPLPGWLLRIREVSNGYYQVALCDRNNRRIELSCGENELIEKTQECLDWAAEVDATNHVSRINDAHD